MNKLKTNSQSYLGPFITMVVLMSLVGLITSINQQFQAPMQAAYRGAPSTVMVARPMPSGATQSVCRAKMPSSPLVVRMESCCACPSNFTPSGQTIFRGKEAIFKPPLLRCRR